MKLVVVVWVSSSESCLAVKLVQFLGKFLQPEFYVRSSISKSRFIYRVEAVSRRCSAKNVFLKMSQNS